MLYSKNSVTSLEEPRRASLWVSISFSLEGLDFVLFFAADGSLLREEDIAASDVEFGVVVLVGD